MKPFWLYITRFWWSFCDENLPHVVGPTVYVVSSSSRWLATKAASATVRFFVEAVLL